MATPFVCVKPQLLFSSYICGALFKARPPCLQFYHKWQTAWFVAHQIVKTNIAIVCLLFFWKEKVLTCSFLQWDIVCPVPYQDNSHQRQMERSTRRKHSPEEKKETFQTSPYPLVILDGVRWWTLPICRCSLSSPTPLCLASNNGPHRTCKTNSSQPGHSVPTVALASFPPGFGNKVFQL